MGLKTGVVAVTKSAEHISRVVVKYAGKFSEEVALGQSTGKITSAEAAAINAWVSNTQATLSALRKLSGY